MLIQEVNLSGHIVLWKKQKWELCIGLKYGAELIVRMSFLMELSVAMKKRFIKETFEKLNCI